MKLAKIEHTSRPWRVHEITPEFKLEDVWALPTPGGPDDFHRLVEEAVTIDPAESTSRTVRTLFEIRWKVGGLFGWDDDDAGLGARVPTLRDRLPADLRLEPGPAFEALPFTPLYLLDNEFAAEMANRTAHGVMHLGWVEDEERGGYRGQMAVYVKRNGLFGAAYMAAIAPFRHLLVYPLLLRQIEREWPARLAGPAPA
jgi:hypothetical protein